MRYTNHIPRVAKLTVGSLIIVGLSISSSSSFAGSKPKNSKRASSTDIRTIHAGKTWKWKPKGGSYWAKGGEFEAVSPDGNAYASGKWRISSGTLCYNGTWHWKDGTHKRKKVKNCWKHVVDSEGQLWQRAHDKENWYQFSTKNLSRGNRVGRKIKRLKRKIGS